MQIADLWIFQNSYKEFCHYFTTLDLSCSNQSVHAYVPFSAHFHELLSQICRKKYAYWRKLYWTESKSAELVPFLVLKFIFGQCGTRDLKSNLSSIVQENIMSKDYITKIKVGQVEAFRISDSRVSLDSVVYSWLQGDSPETIADNFPALTLEEVYGAIAFYLANREMVDEYLSQGETLAEERKQEWRSKNSALYRRLLALKEERKKQVA